MIQLLLCPFFLVIRLTLFGDFPVFFRIWESFAIDGKGAARCCFVFCGVLEMLLGANWGLEILLWLTVF